jgi:hypothetical protein
VTIGDSAHLAVRPQRMYISDDPLLFEFKRAERAVTLEDAHFVWSGTACIG